jgi:hypothetical protein
MIEESFKRFNADPLLELAELRPVGNWVGHPDTDEEAEHDIQVGRFADVAFGEVIEMLEDQELEDNHRVVGVLSERGVVIRYFRFHERPVNELVHAHQEMIRMAVDDGLVRVGAEERIGEPFP